MTKSFKLLQETRRAFSSVARNTHIDTSFLKPVKFSRFVIWTCDFAFKIRWIAASEAFWSRRKSFWSFCQPKLVFPVSNYSHAINSWRNKSKGNNFILLLTVVVTFEVKLQIIQTSKEKPCEPTTVVFVLRSASRVRIIFGLCGAKRDDNISSVKVPRKSCSTANLLKNFDAHALVAKSAVSSGQIGIRQVLFLVLFNNKPLKTVVLVNMTPTKLAFLR